MYSFYLLRPIGYPPHHQIILLWFSGKYDKKVLIVNNTIKNAFCYKSIKWIKYYFLFDSFILVDATFFAALATSLSPEIWCNIAKLRYHKIVKPSEKWNGKNIIFGFLRSTHLYPAPITWISIYEDNSSFGNTLDC